MTPIRDCAYLEPPLPNQPQVSCNCVDENIWREQVPKNSWVAEGKCNWKTGGVCHTTQAVTAQNLNPILLNGFSGKFGFTRDSMIFRMGLCERSATSDTGMGGGGIDSIRFLLCVQPCVYGTLHYSVSERGREIFCRVPQEDVPPSSKVQSQSVLNLQGLSIRLSIIPLGKCRQRAFGAPALNLPLNWLRGPTALNLPLN